MSAPAQIRLDSVSLDYRLFGAKPKESTRDNVGARRTRGRLEALRDISFTLGEGEKLGVIGHNGSGKTSLLKVLAGILHPDRGQVEVTGERAGLFNLGMGIKPALTGEQNIYLRGLAHGLSPDEARAKIPGIADFTELTDYIDLPVRTYSAGMQMRLIFALATGFGQDILLLDEWIGAGDAGFQAKVEARMQALVDRAGIVVLASHRPRIVQTLCTKVLWLHRGEMRRMGPADEVMPAYLEAMEQKAAG